jgi:protein involved in polysaccharide export with SLBB domain
MGRRITLGQIVAAAGGLDRKGVTTAQVIRRGDSGDEEVIWVPLDEVLDGSEPDLYLQPNDTVHIGAKDLPPAAPVK